MMMWQPIETAPKDKDVLLYCPMRGAVRGRWNDCKHATNPRPYWTHDRERLYGVISTRNDQPTHWMPLPEIPNAQAQPAPSVPSGLHSLETIRCWADAYTHPGDDNFRGHGMAAALLREYAELRAALAAEAKP